VGQMMSMGLATVIVTVIVGRVQITPEHHPAFIEAVRLSFRIFAATCFVGIFASLARGSTRNPSTDTPPPGPPQSGPPSS